MLDFFIVFYKIFQKLKVETLIPCTKSMHKYMVSRELNGMFKIGHKCVVFPGANPVRELCVGQCSSVHGVLHSAGFPAYSLAFR